MSAMVVNMTGDVHDFIWDSSDSFAGTVILIPDQTGRSMTGIDPYGRCQEPAEVCLVNGGSHSVTIPHNNSGSTNGMRFLFEDSLNHTLEPGQLLWGQLIESVNGRVGWWMQF